MAEKELKLDDERIAKLVNQDFESSIGAPGGEIALEREEAYDYYLQREFGDEEENRSKAVTSDVADMVDGYMPSLMRIFTTADNVVSFDATSIDDEPAAQQESDYVSHIFFKRNPSFEITFFWMFDALVRKTGIVKAFWDKSEKVTYHEYTGLTEEEHLRMLLDDELSVHEKTERTKKIENEQGEVVDQQVFDVTYKRVAEVSQVRVVNVPPDEYRVSADNRSLDPGAGRMVGQEREVTRGELLEMGFDKKLVNSLEPDRLQATSERAGREDKTDDDRDSKETKPVEGDKSQDVFVLREAYKKLDVDGDGKAELMQVFVVNETVLDKEPIEQQPFHMLCPLPLPHKHIGRALAERGMDIQRVSSQLLRQILNNLYQTNNPGHAVWEQGMTETTLDDLLSRELGNVTTFRRPVGESYAPLAVPFTAGESFPMVQYFDKVKRDRVGINQDSEGLNPDDLKHVQQGAMDRATDISRMKIEMVARIFAETGFKSLFRHIHSLVLKHQQKEDIFRLRGQYIPVTPKTWRVREDMTVNVGLGIGTREANMQHLERIWGMQTQMVEGGGLNLTVTPKNLYNTASEMVKEANYKEPAMFFTDPGDKPAPPPSSEQEELQKQQQALMQRQQQLDQMDQQIKQQKVALDQQQAQMRHQKEVGELQRKMEKDKDDFTVAMEKLSNQLTEIALKYNQNFPDDKIPGSGA